jgi:hypothetical protein
VSFLVFGGGFNVVVVVVVIDTVQALADRGSTPSTTANENFETFDTLF